jgi:oxygen-independent coproporphyrinogen-3 oxidase
VTTEYLQLLAELGFNRTSLGVQDFNLEVQTAVHRIQPFEMVERTVIDSHDAGFESINFDLIYGLPKQNLASFSRTLDQVIALSPDRIALYNYAHLPTRFKPQRRIAEADLPSAEERLQIFMMSLKRLLDEGYVYIGLDHFAKPGDSLAKATLDGSLHRNFQGYTTHSDCDLIALGLSAIGKIGDSYVQNIRSLDEYYSLLDQGELPVEKGIHLSQDDLLRRRVITDLMCSNPINFDQLESQYGINFAGYFSDELDAIQLYADEGLIRLDGSTLSVTPKGRLFVRAVAMAFDQYLVRQSTAKYSRLI